MFSVEQPLGSSCIGSNVLFTVSLRSQPLSSFLVSCSVRFPENDDKSRPALLHSPVLLSVSLRSVCTSALVYLSRNGVSASFSARFRQSPSFSTVSSRGRVSFSSQDKQSLDIPDGDLLHDYRLLALFSPNPELSAVDGGARNPERLADLTGRIVEDGWTSFDRRDCLSRIVE